MTELDELFAKEVLRRREWLIEWFGEKCPDYEEYCHTCVQWALQEEFERETNYG